MMWQQDDDKSAEYLALVDKLCAWLEDNNEGVSAIEVMHFERTAVMNIVASVVSINEALIHYELQFEVLQDPIGAHATKALRHLIKEIMGNPVFTVLQTINTNACGPEGTALRKTLVN